MHSYILLTLTVGVLLATAIPVHHNKHYHGYHQLANLPGFYPNGEDTCHPKGTAHTRHFHHRTPEGHHILFHYNVTYRKEYNFAELKHGVKHIACTDNNTLVLARFRTPELARAFMLELEISHVVSSFPPILCQDSNPVSMFVRQGGLMLDNVTVFIGGEPINPTDLFEHAFIHFETNMLGGNTLGMSENDRREEEEAFAHRHRHHANTSSHTYETLADPPAAPAMRAATDLFKTKPWEFISRTDTDKNNAIWKTAETEAAAREKLIKEGNLGKIDQAGPKPATLPTKSPYGDPLTHRRRRMEPEGLFGWLFGDDALMSFKVNWAYRPKSSKDLQKTLAELEKNGADGKVDADNLRKIATSTDLWEWNFNVLGADKDNPTFLDAPNRNGVNAQLKEFIQALGTFFGPVGKLTKDGKPIFQVNMGVKASLLPLLIFRIDFSTSYSPNMLKAYEFSMSFYYQARMNLEFVINPNGKWEPFSKTLFSLTPVCVPIPVTFVALTLCPKTELKFSVNMELSAKLSKKYSYAIHGWKKFGWSGDRNVPEGSATNDDFMVTVPYGFDTFLGKMCTLKPDPSLGVTLPAPIKVSSLDYCSQKCATKATCKGIAYDTKDGTCYVLPYDSKACEGFDGSVFAVAYSALNKIAFAAGDKTVRLWDPATTTAPTALIGHTEAVFTLAFSKDGKFIVSGSSDKTVRTWDATTMKVVKKFEGHTDSIRGVTFSPDGKQIASVSDDKLLKVWDVTTGKELYTCPGHNSAVNSVAWSPDGVYIVTGSDDTDARRWKATKDCEYRTIGKSWWGTTANDKIRTVSYAPVKVDGTQYVAVSGDDEVVRTFDAEGGEILFFSTEVKKKFTGHHLRVNSVAWSPDGKYMASASNDNTVRYWAYSGDETAVLKEIKGHSGNVNSVAFSPDGKTLVTCSDDKTVRTWDVATGNQVKLYDMATATAKNVLVLGSSDTGTANTIVFFNKVGRYFPDDFELGAPWTTKVEAKISFQLSIEQTLILGIGDVSGNLFGVNLGGPFVALVFTLLLQGSAEGKSFDSALANKLNSLPSTATGWNLLDIKVHLMVALNVGLAIDFAIKFLGMKVPKLTYQKKFTLANLWSWGGDTAPLFQMQFVVMSAVDATTKETTYSIPCPINMMYTIPFKTPQLYIDSENEASKFNWKTKKPLCPDQWKVKSGHHSLRALSGGSEGPQASDTFRGICDAEVFSYTTTLSFIDEEQALLNILVDQGPIAGHEAVLSACRVRGSYRVRGNWSDGYVEMVHLNDAVYDVAGCWMQPIPTSIRVKLTTAGSNYGLWMYHNSPYCADQHLRYGTVETTLQEGESLINEMTMESPYAQLVMHKDGNLVLYGYESDLVLWESGTGVAGNSPVESTVKVTDGVVTLTTLTAGVSTSTVLNKGSAVGGRFLAVYQCDLQLYPDNRMLPWTSVWNATNKECPDATGKRVGPKWHRGGSYLFRGESLLPNSGISNGNGMFEHERGRVHFVNKKDLKTLWSLTDEKIRGVRTAALTFQWNGDLVLVDYEGKAIWRSNTANLGATVLHVEKCGIALYKSYPTQGLVWSYGLNYDCPAVEDSNPLAQPPPITSFPTPLNNIEPGQNILPGQSVLSQYGQLYHQPNGDVVLLSRDNRTIPTALWSTKTAGKCTSALTFQYDGALLLYGCGGEILWDAGIITTRPKAIELRDDCVLNAYDQAVHAYIPTQRAFLKSVITSTCSVNVPVSPYIDLTDYYWVEAGYDAIRGQTIATTSAALTLQPDGNLVFYALNPVRTLWQSGTQGKCVSSYGIVNGNLVIYDCASTIMWSLLPESQRKSDALYYTIDGYRMIIQNKYSDELWNSVDRQILVLATPGPTSASSGANNNNNSNTIEEQTLIWAVIVACAVTALCVGVVVFLVMRSRNSSSSYTNRNGGTTDLEMGKAPYPWKNPNVNIDPSSVNVGSVPPPPIPGLPPQNNANPVDDAF